MANTKKPESDKAEKKPTATKKKAALQEGVASDKSAKAKRQPTGKKRAPLMPKTFFAEQGKIGKWKLIDASGQTLGRLSTQIAQMLMGKTEPGYTRFHDTGDSIVVINAAQVRLTGKKWDDKVYNYHTSFPGGIKTITAKEMLARHPEWLVEWAVHGMLPTGHMGRRWRKKLKVFAGSQHEHHAQKPVVTTLPHTGQYFE